MNEYAFQAQDFLKKCNAQMTINYMGLRHSNWDDKPHDFYMINIVTPRGTMSVNFYDSLYNTELKNLPFDKLYEKRHNRYYNSLLLHERTKFINQIKKEREDNKITEYDILASLEKYDVGSIDDFIHEFGYEINCTKDMTNCLNTYNAVVEQYRDICRCFTTKQIEALREIW